jgi:hypothetical protein
MRKRRSYMRRLNKLPTEQKILVAGALTIIIACFLPWYGISSRVISQWWSGFGNIGSVAGYSISLLALGIILLTVLPAWDVKIKLPWKNEHISIALAAEATFLTLVFMLVYAQYSLYDSPSSSIRFGLYTALIAAVATFIASMVTAKNTEKGRPSLHNADLVKMPRHHRELEEEPYSERRESELASQNTEVEQESIEEELAVHQQELLVAESAELIDEQIEEVRKEADREVEVFQKNMEEPKPNNENILDAEELPPEIMEQQKAPSIVRRVEEPIEMAEEELEEVDEEGSEQIVATSKESKEDEESHSFSF